VLSIRPADHTALRPSFLFSQVVGGMRLCGFREVIAAR
jgi:hypothetical protein